MESEKMNKLMVITALTFLWHMVVGHWKCTEADQRPLNQHSRHRSPFNFAVNLIAGLIAYTRQPRKPHIDVSELTEGVPMAF